MRFLCQVAAIGLLVNLLSLAAVRGAGTYLSSGGPVNQSMGGASTAAPVDVVGATYWNPATTSALPNEIGFGLGVLVPRIETSSSVPGLGSGTSTGEPGAAVLPTVGWVHRRKDSPVTLALGVHAVAGFRTNYSSSTTNPIFAPQSNDPGVPGGFGRLFTGAEFLQVAPSISIAPSERLSFAFGPTVTVGQIFFDPLLSTPPDDADGNGAFRYPSGTGSRYHWGGGAQIGAYYIADNFWHFGASIKSPQWMEDFRFKAEDELGRPRVGRFKIDLPMIISVGTAYSGFENLELALDVRYFDYKNTDGFGPHGFKADGSLNGLGMSSVMAVALGAQVRLSETRYLRAGYTFNQSPFQSAETTFAVAAPLFYQHQIHAGMSQKLSPAVSLNMAYSYWPEATKSGPLVTPAGTVPGSNVTTSESAHHAILGVGVRY